MCFEKPVYDHLGRRVKKMNQESRQKNPGGLIPLTYWHTNEVTTFVYDGWNMIHEIVAQTNGTVDEIEYVWGLDLSGTLQGAGGVGGLLFEKRNGNIFIPCYDANGNITAYVDTNGTVRAYRQFDAFGNTVAKGGDMVGVFNFWFSTKYLDHDTGLYYYGYRYYSPLLQRWINRDAIEESGGANLYGFVGNNSVSIIDLLGMWHGAVMVITSPFDPGWSIYASDFVAVDLNKTAAALEKLNATSSKTTRKCRLSVANQGLKKFGNSVIERQIRTPTSPGGTVDPNIIDDVFLWTKHDSGKPIGVDIDWLSQLEQPNGKLFWAGSYTEEYKQNYMKHRKPSIYPKEDVRDWIVAQGKGQQNTWGSARWLLEQIRDQFNDADCTYCKIENGKETKYSLKFEIGWQPIDKNLIARKYGEDPTYYPKTPNYPVLKINQQ